MIKTEAQNKYFEALNAMQNIYQNDDQIDSLLDNMFAEFDHNTINLDYGNSFALLVIIGKRFNTGKKGKVNKLYPSDHQLKFEKLIMLHDKELKLKSFNPLPEKNLRATINKRIKWKGTPGEFGAIFNLLFENGYIENPIIKKDMVEQLNKIFEIRTEENKIATDKYIYRCFGEKIYKYPAGLLKIPLSINYHKDK